MGRFKRLVDSEAGMEGFRARYHILQGVTLQYCAPHQILTDRKEGKVVIPMIAFIEGGMTLPMGRVTRDYLINPVLLKARLSAKHKAQSPWGFFPLKRSSLSKARFF